MSRFKRTICLICAFFVAFATMSGCSLFTKDIKYDNAQTVAEIGNGMRIDKKQLINAFGDYGYQYLQSGYSVADAYAQTLDLIIDRDVAAKLSLDMFGGLNDEEAALVRKSSYNYIEQSFRAREKEIRAKKKLAYNEESNDTSTPEPEGVMFKPYEKYLIENGVNAQGKKKFTLNVEKLSAESTEAPPTWASDDEFLDYLLTPLNGNQDVINETLNRLIGDLKTREDGVGQRPVPSTKSPFGYEWKYFNVEYSHADKTRDRQLKRDAITREMVRVQKEETKNALAKRFEQYFEYALGIGENPLDYEIKTLSTNVSTNQLEEVTKRVNLMQLKIDNKTQFERILREKSQSYVDGIVDRVRQNFVTKIYDLAYERENGYDSTADSDYSTKLLDSLKDTYYVPASVAEKFFTVSHVLLKYDEAQTAEIERIKSEENNIDVRNELIKEEQRKLKVKPVGGDGKIATEGVGAEQILNEIMNYVYQGAEPSTVKLSDRYDRFRDMIYKYNGDPGMQNPDAEYVIGVDTRIDQTINSTETDNASRMVPEFSRASRALYNFNKDKNQGGKMTVGEYNELFNRDLKQSGSIDTRGMIYPKLVWTDYGAHIIMYTRNIGDFIFTNNSQMAASQADSFLFGGEQTVNGVKTAIGGNLTSYGDKTYFDRLVEEITKPDISTAEKQLIKNFKADIKIKIYKKNYKDLTKN